MTPAVCQGPGAGVDPHDFAAALLDPSRPAPAGLRAWNGSDPAVRLAVHRNNVVSSLVDALAETFPVVRELVGPAFFQALAVRFVRQSPPRSPVLARHGQGFARFIAADAAARCLPYLADVARLEWARVRAYHAADAPPLSDAMVALALASGERTGELQLALHPSVATFDSPFAVVSLWAAHQGLDGAAEPPAPVDIDRPECALVLRAHLDVLVLPASASAVAFVSALQGGCDLGAAAAHAMGIAPCFDLSATLAPLLAHGALASIHLPQDPHP